MNDNLQSYYLRKEEAIKSCLLALRDVILEQDEHVSETRKWNSPCFCYKNKMFCFLMVDKKNNYPYLLMVEGARLDFPELVQGNRTRMKTLAVDPTVDIPIKTIERILNSALDLYRKGIIPTKG